MAAASLSTPARARGTRVVSGATTVSVTILPRAGGGAARANAGAAAAPGAGGYLVFHSRQGALVTRHIYY